jgi:GntR family transcriptional regulator, rspAB operon transcriptional repressor
MAGCCSFPNLRGNLVFKNTFSHKDVGLILSKVLSDFCFDGSSPFSTQAYKFLRQKIISMELPPGLPLIEAKISRELGASRTPVREALRQLANEHLIDVFPQSGNVVSPIRAELVESAVFIRSALEIANIRTLAGQINAKQLLELQQNLQLQELALKEESYAHFYELDEQLHCSFFRFCGREQVWELILSIKAHLDRARILALPFFDMAGRDFSYHQLLVSALEKGDPDAAGDYMKRHQDSLNNILTRYKNEITQYSDRKA